MLFILKGAVSGQTYEPPTEAYPNSAEINDCYSEEGPPVVTYYAPPPDYYYLYSWVPCPFWWNNFWFSGFFVLRDFHRIIHVHNRAFVVTNHFNHIENHRVFRIDPAERFRGKTFAGIGAPRTRAFIPTGIPQGERMIFNSGRERLSPVKVRKKCARGAERVRDLPAA